MSLYYLRVDETLYFPLHMGVSVSFVFDIIFHSIFINLKENNKKTKPAAILIKLFACNV